MNNSFTTWLKRCVSIGFIVGTAGGLIFVVLSASPRPLLLIPLETAFALVLGCISWPLAFRVLARPQSRLCRIAEATLYGGIIGAVVLMPFSQGWAMALFQAIEGAFMGALLGTVIGVAFRWKGPAALSPTT